MNRMCTLTKLDALAGTKLCNNSAKIWFGYGYVSESVAIVLKTIYRINSFANYYYWSGHKLFLLVSNLIFGRRRRRLHSRSSRGTFFAGHTVQMHKSNNAFSGISCV